MKLAQTLGQGQSHQERRVSTVPRRQVGEGCGDQVPGGKPGTDLGQPQEAPESDPELGSLGFGRPEPTLPPDLSGHLLVQPHTVF